MSSSQRLRKAVVHLNFLACFEHGNGTCLSLVIRTLLQLQLPSQNGRALPHNGCSSFRKFGCILSESVNLFISSFLEKLLIQTRARRVLLLSCKLDNSVWKPGTSDQGQQRARRTQVPQPSPCPPSLALLPCLLEDRYSPWLVFIVAVPAQVLPISFYTLHQSS